MLNRTLLPLLLAGCLAACGFHLRGPASLPAVLKQTHIKGVAEFDPLRLELKRVLTNAGAQVLPAEAKTPSAIVISNVNYARRVLSVDAQGRAAEYALNYSFFFQVNDASAKILVPRQQIRISRDFRFDPNAVLAKDSEEQQIRTEMIRQSVRLLMRRVDATMQQKQP
ncbi:MAG: LPS assembly lipoprotein LptE [Gammaproteobacteria bacterium]